MLVYVLVFVFIGYQIEVVFNVLWLWYCVSEEELMCFLVDGSGKSMCQLVMQVDSVLVGCDGQEVVIFGGYWVWLSDFVFFGECCICCWLDVNEVDVMYLEEVVIDLVELFNFMVELGLVSYCIIYDKYFIMVCNVVLNVVKMDLVK